MSVDSKIRTAITPIVAVCVPNQYDGAETEYCVFEYTESPLFSADGVALMVSYDITINWYLPTGENPNAKKAQIRDALIAMGCGYPTIMPIPEEDGQHWVFECSYEETV